MASAFIVSLLIDVSRVQPARAAARVPLTGSASRHPAMQENERASFQIVDDPHKKKFYHCIWSISIWNAACHGFFRAHRTTSQAAGPNISGSMGGEGATAKRSCRSRALLVARSSFASVRSTCFQPNRGVAHG
jgi:hypothetical protein